MNEESARSGDLSNSWFLVTDEAANAAASPAAPPEAEQPPPLPASPTSSSDHSDFEIFDEDEGGALSDPSEPPPPPPPPPLTPPPPPCPGQRDPAPPVIAPAIEAPRPRPRQERRAQERRLLLALRSLRGDGATGSATPSPMEAPASPTAGHVTVKQEPPRIQIIQHSAEEESLPESDIQIEDAQNMQGGPELIEELMEGDRVRRYQHSPNAHLNARLNGLVMCAVLFVLGLAVGHFLGSTHERFSNHFERVDRNDRIKSIQTELLQCARKYDELELQLNEVKATLVQKEYVDKWESLYQEGEEEKAALTATMNLYKSRYNTQKQLLTQCELRFGELEEKVSKEKLRNVRCQPCPKVDLSCPRELQAVKSSMRALLQLPGSPPLRPLPCDLTTLLPSWPALRAFLSNRLHNATALLMEALPAEWTKLHDDLLRSPRRFWSKLTGRKAAREAKEASPKPKPKAAMEKAGEKQNRTTVLPPQPTKNDQRKVNWFLQRRPAPTEEEEAAEAEEVGEAGGRRKDSSWFWRDKDTDAATSKKEDPTTDGFWYWRRKGRKLPPLSTEYFKPPVRRTGTQQEPPAKSEHVWMPPVVKEQKPPAPIKEETPPLKWPAPPATKAQEPPASTKEEKSPASTPPLKWQAPPATKAQKPPAPMPDESSELPTAGSEDWPSPGDIDDESEPSDWLEAFMQLREQMMRAQLRIWRSLKQMATKRMGSRPQKAKRRRRKKRKNRKKKQRWSWESEGE